MIIFSNVRISVAMSQFYRDRQVMLATDRHTERTSADAAAAAAAAAAVHGSSSSSSQGRRLRHQNSLTTAPNTSVSHVQRRNSILINCSVNQLQMKVCVVFLQLLLEVATDH